MPKALKVLLIALGAVVGAAVIVVVGYVIYLQTTYYRIADETQLEIENNSATTLSTSTEYKAATFNVGFGAYTPEFSFFMDEGVMNDGTKTVGEHSLAASRETVEANTAGVIGVLEGLAPDFVLMQEVDTDSTRSYRVNQKELVESAFPSLGSTFASNFHSAFLAYPPTEPHGVVNSGLLTLNGARVDEAVRRSYPVDESFPTKFFDLDRCFVVERLPVENGKQLVLVNSHMSAFDEGGKIRAQQLELLMGVLATEAAAGNYVIAGGDWNHALCGSESLYPSEQQIPPWLALFNDADVPAGLSVVRADNIAEVSTCRDTDIPYEKGVTYTSTVDGFIVSDNVKARATNVDAGYLYSDHNPVLLTFELG